MRLGLADPAVVFFAAAIAAGVAAPAVVFVAPVAGHPSRPGLADPAFEFFAVAIAADVAAPAAAPFAARWRLWQVAGRAGCYFVSAPFVFRFAAAGGRQAAVAFFPDYPVVHVG